MSQESQDDRKIFVGGLPADATQEDVQEYFQQFGTVEMCNVKFDRETNRSRGFCFVAFSTVDEMKSVLEQSHEIKGKKVDVKKANPEVSDDTVKKIFVGGLESSTTKEQIETAFSSRGEVTEIFMPVEKQPDGSETSKGYAFVSFKDSNLPAILCAEGQITINDKECQIKKAKQKNDRGGFRGGRGRGGYGGYYGGGGGGGGYDMYGGGYGGGNYNQYGGGQYGGGQYGGGYGQGYDGYGNGYSGGQGGYGGSSWGGGYNSYGGQYQNKMKGGRGGSSYQPY